MLLAHLVPGYFAAILSEPYWKPEWSRHRRIILWTAALVSTFAPDIDVIRNILFRGFIGHSILWTHSLFPHLGIALCWWLLRRSSRWPYVQTLVGLIAIGGLSHLLLDVVAHSTPLFYPVSDYMVGVPSERVLVGKFWGYITDPIYLLEPLLLAVAAVHWISTREPSLRLRWAALTGVAVWWVAVSLAFLNWLPTLQRAADVFRHV